MSDSADYSQPDFFRFGSDALLLVSKVVQGTVLQGPIHLLELGIGSGVIACELSQRLSIQLLTGVEAQPEWKPHLEFNLARFCKTASWNIQWQKVSEFNISGTQQFDLIVCNPPYYTPESGRPSPDRQRDNAHRFVLDSWSEWLRCMERSLAPHGEVWCLQKDPDVRVVCLRKSDLKVE